MFFKNLGILIKFNIISLYYIGFISYQKVIFASYTLLFVIER